MHLVSPFFTLLNVCLFILLLNAFGFSRFYSFERMTFILLLKIGIFFLFYILLFSLVSRISIKCCYLLFLFYFYSICSFHMLLKIV